MAITNWAQVGSSAHQGSMDRAQLQLARRRQAQSEQAQRFGQQRAQALDAEERRRYDDRRADVAYDRKHNEEQEAHNRAQAERAYADHRADVAWQRAQTERAYADQRADVARAQEAQDFDRMLKNDEAARRQALFDRQNAEYQKLQRQEDERKAALEAGFASLLSNGIARGQRDAKGNILIPKQYIDVFNKANGTTLSGLVVATQDGGGNPLPFPQILTLEPQSGPDGKPVVDQATGRPAMAYGVMPMAQVQAMFQAFPGVPQAFSQTMPEQSRAWMRTLGLGQTAETGEMDAGDRLGYDRWAYEQDAKDYRALAGATVPNVAEMEAAFKRMEARRKRMDAMVYGGQEAEPPNAGTPGDGKDEKPKEKRFPFMAPDALNAL